MDKDKIRCLCGENHHKNFVCVDGVNKMFDKHKDCINKRHKMKFYIASKKR
jgi:hypothetical protein